MIRINFKIARLIINLTLLITLNFQALTPMFTFQGDSSLFRKGLQKLNSIPDIIQPRKLQSLPPLPFYIEATEPLSDFRNTIIESKSDYVQKMEKCERERDQLQQKFENLCEDYAKIKRQYEQLKFRYREGEQMFMQMESQNLRLHHQIESMRNKKQQKSKINVGIKRKQIPIVKINVPNPKVISQQSEKQSMYRQLKTASEQLAYVKKLLQSEKQKFQHSNNLLTKNIQKLTAQRESLRAEIIQSQQQVKRLKQQILRNKNSQSQGHNSTRGTQNQENNKIEKLKFQLQRLQKVHKTCDILILSKQTEILELKSNIQKLRQEAKHHNEGSDYFQETQSRRKFNDQKQTNMKQRFEIRTHLQESSQKQISDFGNIEYNHLLEQHLSLSVKQMKSIQQFIKSLVNDFIGKIDSLRKELQWSNQKMNYQKDELERVYELLRNKKSQLDNCYSQLKNAGKNIKFTPVKQLKQEDEYLKSILKYRRNFSA